MEQGQFLFCPIAKRQKLIQRTEEMQAISKCDGKSSIALNIFPWLSRLSVYQWLSPCSSLAWHSTLWLLNLSLTLLGTNMTESRKYKFGQCSGNNKLICFHSTHATFMNTHILQKKNISIERQGVLAHFLQVDNQSHKKFGVWSFLFLIAWGLQQPSAMIWVSLPTFSAIFNSRYKQGSTELTSKQLSHYYLIKSGSPFLLFDKALVT